MRSLRTDPRPWGTRPEAQKAGHLVSGCDRFYSITNRTQDPRPAAPFPGCAATSNAWRVTRSATFTSPPELYRTRAVGLTRRLRSHPSSATKAVTPALAAAKLDPSAARGAHARGHFSRAPQTCCFAREPAGQARRLMRRRPQYDGKRAAADGPWGGDSRCALSCRGPAHRANAAEESERDPSRMRRAGTSSPKAPQNRANAWRVTRSATFTSPPESTAHALSG